MPAEKKYRCYYPHQWRDSLSPVCGIFNESTLRPILSSSRDVSLYIYLYIHLCIFISPFHVIFMCGRTRVERHSSKNSCGASLSKIASVVLSASVKRFFVSRMRDFCYYFSFNTRIYSNLPETSLLNSFSTGSQ